jgi:exosortase
MLNHSDMKQRGTNILIGLLLSVFGIVFWKTFYQLIKYWYSSEDFSHGFFIIPISLYIIWQKRDALEKLELEKFTLGRILSVFSLLLFIAARLGNIVTLERYALVLFVAGSVAYLFGARFFKLIIFPILFLFLMIPIPSQIYSAATIPLQLLVSKISVALLYGMGYPVLREGNIIHFPNHVMQVVQACSGLRSMLSLFTLSLIFGYFTLNSIFLRTIMFIASVPISIIINVIRVTIMGISLHRLDLDLTVGKGHTFTGVGIFVCALLILIILQRLLLRWDTH